MAIIKDTSPSRYRKYLLTVNNPTENGVTDSSITKAVEKIKTKYIAFCYETGSQGTYHVHIYFYFYNAVNFSTIKSLFPTAHIDKVNGTSAQVKDYILKSAPEYKKNTDGSYEYKDSTGKIHSGINHSDTFQEFGECPCDQQGRRKDLQYMYSLVKEGYSDAEILELCPNTAIKHIDKINKLRHSYLTDKFRGTRRLNLKVHYITGKTGKGKSRDILDVHGDENVYRVTDYLHPFDSYQCQEVIVFEEFRSSIRLQDMLNYLDIYPVILPARYSPKVGCFTEIYVVSNWTFEMQYSELQKDYEQRSSYEAWIRRFNGVVKEYTDTGIITYPTLQDYLNRKTDFKPVSEDIIVPFDNSEQEKMPFDD